jgi:RimJ/RimL family protein N-acetyltransferase
MRNSDRVDEIVRGLMDGDLDIAELSTMETEQVLERMMLMADAFRESQYADVAEKITQLAAEALEMDYEPPELEDDWDFEDHIIAASEARGNTYWEIENDAVH